MWLPDNKLRSPAIRLSPRTSPIPGPGGGQGNTRKTLTESTLHGDTQFVGAFCSSHAKKKFHVDCFSSDKESIENLKSEPGSTSHVKAPETTIR